MILPLASGIFFTVDLPPMLPTDDRASRAAWMVALMSPLASVSGAVGALPALSTNCVVPATASLLSVIRCSLAKLMYWRAIFGWFVVVLTQVAGLSTTTV